MSEDEQEEPDPERVQERAIDRQHERTESVEDMIGPEGEMFDEDKYPVTAEELAVEYGDQEIDLPNETESLADVFDRIVDERFESPAEARRAILNEISTSAEESSAYQDEYAAREPDDRPE